MRPILATISQSALRHNLAVVKQHAPNSKVMAVVKANGYGHGLINVAYGLADAEAFAVLGLNEAIDLREAGFEHRILLLEGIFRGQELGVAASFGIDLVVHSAPQLEIIERAKLVRPVRIHLKVNTGMNRLGFMPEDFLSALQRLRASPNVSEITLMTHFANADDVHGIDAPFDLFHRTIKGLDQPISMANSASILRHPQSHTDWVRPGIMLYGATPVSSVAATSYGLNPVMQFTSEIIAVQTVRQGKSVGYGNRFTATRTTKVGVVACGYADGYPRHAGLQSVEAHGQHGAPIAVNGQLTRTLGRVSMDMLFCDLTSIPAANVGSPVELWGNQVPVDDVAKASDTVGYELLCAVSPRVPLKAVE
ncbi:MAG: alanine racemase [Betaproteobacteria bacterium HGW-Betaproteobacteria-22]|nr:MAG: alanine racemase [Betaproteobacteria bacterium HGW-Betaproteobacteria-22]